MMMACINYIHVSILTLVEPLTFFSSKGADLFFRREFYVLEITFLEIGLAIQPMYLCSKVLDSQGKS